MNPTSNLFFAGVGSLWGFRKGTWVSAQDRAGFGKPAFVRVFTGLPPNRVGLDTISASVARLRLSHQSGAAAVWY